MKKEKTIYTITYVDFMNFLGEVGFTKRVIEEIRLEPDGIRIVITDKEYHVAR